MLLDSIFRWNDEFWGICTINGQTLRVTRKQYSAEKIRIILEGLRGESPSLKSADALRKLLFTQTRKLSKSL